MEEQSDFAKIPLNFKGKRSRQIIKGRFYTVYHREVAVFVMVMDYMKCFLDVLRANE